MNFRIDEQENDHFFFFISRAIDKSKQKKQKMRILSISIVQPINGANGGIKEWQSRHKSDYMNL